MIGFLFGLVTGTFVGIGIVAMSPKLYARASNLVARVKGIA